MAPSKFQIYADQSVRHTNIAQPQPPLSVPIMPPVPIVSQQTQFQRYIPAVLPQGTRLYFDERKIYPISGGEFSFEELNLVCWRKRESQLAERAKMVAILRENEELKQQNEALGYQLKTIQQQLKQMQQIQQQPQYQPPQHFQQQQEQQQNHHAPSDGRLSIVAMGGRATQRDYDIENMEPDEEPGYGAVDEAITGLQDCWYNTVAHDVSKNTAPHDIREQTETHDVSKFTLPIDQSQCIRDNAKTSTPTSKRLVQNRRWSRPSMGGSPTLKLSPITETSRDCNSKSSSSSSALSGTPGTAKKEPQEEQVTVIPPIRQLDPNDPTTYQRLLGAQDNLDRRSGYFKMNRSIPKMRQGACFRAGPDSYLVDRELSAVAQMWCAQLLNDDSNDSSNDLQIKTVCFRLDQPANEWLFYICNELHRRLVKQKTKPDIEISVMNANPAIMYSDASILVDEYFRFVTLQDFFDACKGMGKSFPKSVAAYITLELIQLVRQMHSCDIIHLNINPTNILILSCPTRDDIANVKERTSIVKLIGFDRALDTRLLPVDFKFENRLDDLLTCEMMDSKPWTFEVDWFGALNCIYNMFFLEDMKVNNSSGRWAVDKQFKGPTDIWNSIFDELLNIQSSASATVVVNKAIDELCSWVEANISFVLKESAVLDGVLEEYAKSKSMKEK